MEDGVNRTNILVSKLMRKADSLRLVLDGPTVHNSMLELVLDRSVNGITLSLVSVIQ